MFSLIALAAGCGLAAAPPVVTVDRDNIEITESCVIEAGLVPDEDGNGVVHITADNLTVEFAPTPLRGAPADADPDTLAGIGIVVTGSFVTLRGAHVHGYKVGIHAREAEALVIEGCDVSDNFRQRLRSTPLREDPADWLRPHANDDNEWMHRYGAGIYVEESSRPTIHDVRARRVQNGIILDTVSNAKIYDNDCSFLSGWGLALWRCTYCSIVQNAFDFCVRGYSHGVYNRGQDSAGILMFEQCAGNLVAYNSATHCGDGFFGFSGREALGEVRPRDDLEWYRQKGNVDNSLLANDFSYAAAHGIEMTFGFRNRFLANRLVGNAICGIWAGYSQLSQCEMNTIYDNGRMGYGLERGGINIEHSFKNRIRANNFQDNACGIHLWWDEDEALLQTPWARANEQGCDRNIIAGNTFRGDEIAIQLRRTGGVTFIANNTMTDVDAGIVADEESPIDDSDRPISGGQLPSPSLLGLTTPVGARRNLRGREHIFMTEWGPYDWEHPLLRCVERRGDRHIYRLLGCPAPPDEKSLVIRGGVRADVEADRIVVSAVEQGRVTPYELVVDIDGTQLTERGVLAPSRWVVHVFPYKTDPRENVDAWRMEAGEDPYMAHTTALDLRFGMGGLDEALHLPKTLPSDHFGTFASTTLTIPAGAWRIRTTSDDGIRVWRNNELVIDDWTWHAPKEHQHEFTLAEETEVALRVEHFELDGYAVLSLSIEPAD